MGDKSSGLGQREQEHINSWQRWWYKQDNALEMFNNGDKKLEFKAGKKPKSYV